MPSERPSAYSNPRSKHFIRSPSKRRARIKKNIAVGKGTRRMIPMSPANTEGRKYLGWHRLRK